MPTNHEFKVGVETDPQSKKRRYFVLIGDAKMPMRKYINSRLIDLAGSSSFFESKLIRDEVRSVRHSVEKLTESDENVMVTIGRLP